MYIAILTATDPASPAGKPKPGKLPDDDDAKQAQSELEDALKKLPYTEGPSIAAANGSAVLIQGDSPLPHADAVMSALHAYVRAVRGDRKGVLLDLTGYVVDQAGVTKLGTPAG